MNYDNANENNLEIVEQVDELTEEARVLALNLAIYLAKAKGASDEIGRLEPDFVSLVNGTVKVAQEIAKIIGAARNGETMVYDVPSGRIPKDHIEIRLRTVLDQCGRILSTLSSAKDART